ncbi:hypothetical protein Forpe1208_v003193 [Fusarium oxysporum f. sp. rapae]|uniref:Uncharacterized protein n=1 Tax=Fusarium oxysporum f. sp. rapae TaxID=485398 RepID=A0A8J5P8Q6_FUSOX|nr:hypothetical protein Forpe1208_v003193 [Fusarium oxysporum f. sp. rapae]
MGSGKSSNSQSSRSSKRAPAECRVSKCDRAVAHYMNGKDADLCKDHCCEFGPGCDTRTRSGAKFCTNHSKCTWPRCNTKLLDIEGGDFKYSHIGHAEWFCRDRKSLAPG